MNQELLLILSTLRQRLDINSDEALGAAIDLCVQVRIQKVLPERCAGIPCENCILNRDEFTYKLTLEKVNEPRTSNHSQRDSGI